MPELRLEGLQPQRLNPVSLTLAAGECLALHGSSGAGKTLLLRAIADLDPNQGEAFLDNLPRSQIAPNLWRKQVALLPAESHWWTETVGNHADDWPLSTLQLLGFEADVLNWQVTRLSSGERQRLALARMLANRPRALLLDEPTANLDIENTRRVEQLIQDYRKQQQVPAIWVSHDPEQRSRIAHRCAEMIAGKLHMEAE